MNCRPECSSSACPAPRPAPGGLGRLLAAARALLRALRERGARFRYHGDFDWGGIRIANAVFALIDATPWRYTFRDYLEAVDHGHGTPLNTGERPSPPTRSASRRSTSCRNYFRTLTITRERPCAVLPHPP